MTSLVHTLRDHRDDVNCCALSQSLLATCSGDKTIRVYSLQDFTELRFSPLSGHGYAVHCCCFSSCGRYLASCSTDALTKVWSMSTGEVVCALQHPARSPVRVCAFSPDAQYLLSGASDGTVALWQVPSKTLQRCSRVSEGTVLACCFSPCGQMFVTGSTQGELHLWSLNMSSLYIQREAHDLGVNCCQFSPQICMDGPAVKFRLASGGQDNQLRVWIVSQHATAGYVMTLTFTLSAQSAPVLSCAISFDGQLLVSGSVDKTVTVYNADGGELLHTFTQHDRYVTACTFSPCMLMFASGSMDKTVNVWRIEDGNAHSSECLQMTGTGRKSQGYSIMLVSDWSEEDVCDWLRDEGLEMLVDTFRAQNIDGTELISLNKETLDAYFNIESVGLRGKVMRKIEELRSTLMDSDVPDEFLCPVTRELMKDPVIAADGYSYEREALETWIRTPNHTSPMTNLPLQTNILTPNRSLKMAIQRWKASQ
ncbi:WD repeat, SAM and U-box domain-containing protein 1-like isoform X2 [Triplophysa rosa]|uniref:WD repeat, SAM and U-box domain-containing protein 1 n=1 Tax=Triplophysa rosa TaxID=992332 RepID=A0A9W8C634_TRIRA|nr:WD repeat, SAM and U-box domain-containing protein 1-like isoform X2 [Triplophysa rosa]KAI7808405.1 putative WD repeat [Triplophysa rosa]